MEGATPRLTAPAGPERINGAEHPRAPRRQAGGLDPPRRRGDPRWLGAWWVKGGAGPRRSQARILEVPPGQPPAQVARRCRSAVEGQQQGGRRSLAERRPPGRCRIRGKASWPARGRDLELQRPLSSRIRPPGAWGLLSSTALIRSSQAAEAQFFPSGGTARIVGPTLREQLVQRSQPVSPGGGGREAIREGSRRCGRMKLWGVRAAPGSTGWALIQMNRAQ